MRHKGRPLRDACEWAQAGSSLDSWWSVDSPAHADWLPIRVCYSHCSTKVLSLSRSTIALRPRRNLPGIIEDVQDAFRWIAASGDKFRIEPDRLVVCGGSAGGSSHTYGRVLCRSATRRASLLLGIWGTSWARGIHGPTRSTYGSLPLHRNKRLAAVGSTPVSEPPPNNQRGRFYLLLPPTGRSGQRKWLAMIRNRRIAGLRATVRSAT